MFKRAVSFFLAAIMALGMFPLTSITVYAAKKKDTNYFYPAADTVRVYSYIERGSTNFSGDKFNEGCWIDAWPTGEKSTYTFQYIGSYFEYKNSPEYMSSVSKIAKDVSNAYFDVEMNEIIIYKVEREDGLDPLYGAVVAYDPENGACFYAVSTPDGAPVVYNFTDVAGSVRIDVDYYTDHGLGTKEIYHTVTYRDDDGTFLSDQEVRSGKNAIPPSPPTKGGITAQWNHTGEFIESDTEIFADYTGGEVFAPERPEDYYSGGNQPFLRNDYNQQAASREIVPTDVENLVVGHTYEDVQVFYGLWDNQKMHLKELGTYGELASRDGYTFSLQFQKLCEYLSETYSFSINEIMCYDSGMTMGGEVRPCVVMGYDYEYNAVAIAYSLTDLQIHLYSTTDLRDQFIDLTFDIDIMSGHATRETHTVNYVNETGSPVKTIRVQDGKSIETYYVPAVPSKEGYEGVWSHDGAGITGDMTIYPVYTRIGGDKEDTGPYTVNFYMPVWIVNLMNERNGEPPVTDENGNPLADDETVLYYSEQVKHGENVQNIPTIPYYASEAYEWHDWNHNCKDITENTDVIVTEQYGGKRVFAFSNNGITTGKETIVCGSNDTVYGLIHNVTPVDWPEIEPYVKETEIGDWVQVGYSDRESTYRIYSIDVLPKKDAYAFIGSYTDGPRFPESGIHYNITPSAEHLPEGWANSGVSIEYKGLFGDLTAEDLYGSASDAAARYENLANLVNEVAANYKISPSDVPIHDLIVDKETDEVEYVIWLAYNYHDDYNFLISEYGHNYFIDGLYGNGAVPEREEFGKTVGVGCNGTVKSISEKALKLAGKEATAVDMCKITFAFDGKVISEVEAPIGSKYVLPEPVSIRDYKAEGWKLNGELVVKEITVEGSTMRLEASYVQESGANRGLASAVFGYAYYLDYTMSGFTTDKGTVNVGKLRNPKHNGTPMEEMTGEFTLEYFGTYDDLKGSYNDPVIKNLWEDLLIADEEYTPTAKKLPIYKLFRDGEFVCYGIVRAYDAEKGAIIFDGPYDDIANNYVISMTPLSTKNDTIFNINYDGSALPYFSVDTTADNVFFEYAWNIDRIDKIGGYGATGKTDPVVDQYGTVRSPSGKWNLEKLGKYSEIKDEIYTAYLDSTIQIAANLHGVPAGDVIVYDFRNGNTHVAYGSILVQAGLDSGNTKLLFVGDTAKEGSFFAISHETNVEGYCAATVVGNKDYSAAIKKGFDEYVNVSFYANDVKVADMMVASGSVITEFPEVPEMKDYIGSWNYDNSPITGETRIEAVYEFSGNAVDDPRYNKNYRLMEKELATKDIVAIRAGDALLSYVDNKGIAVAEDENGEINAPSKKVQWAVTVNEDGSISFTNTTTGKLLAVFIDENGNTKIGTAVDEEEVNPGDGDIPGIEEGDPIPEPDPVPEPDYEIYRPSGSVNSGDQYIIYDRSSLKNDNVYKLLEGASHSTGILENYDAETGSVNKEDVDDKYAWIITESDICAHGVSGYTIRNVSTGEYLAYMYNGSSSWLGFVKDPVLGQNNVRGLCWHLSANVTEKVNGVTRTITEWHTHSPSGYDRYLYIDSDGNMALTKNSGNYYYMNVLEKVSGQAVNAFAEVEEPEVPEVPGEDPEVPGEDPEEPAAPEIAAESSDWMLENGGGMNYLKVTIEEKTYYLALSGEGEWTAGKTGSPITFWQNPEELVVPEKPVEPEEPDDPESGNGPLSKEELDKNRPENAPKGSYYPISTGESFEDGDRIVIFEGRSIHYDDKFIAFNGETGRLVDLGCEYDSETGVINDLDVPEECVWIVNTANCAHGCCETAYTLKNAKTGEYLVYTDNDELDYVKDPVAGRNGVKTFVWHYTTEGNGNGIEGVSSGWRAYDEYKKDLHYYGVLESGSGVGGEFYTYELFEGRTYNAYVMNRYEIDGTRGYCAVQFVVDGNLYDVKYVFEGAKVALPELPQKEGYSYCWPFPDGTEEVKVNGDMIIEAISSKNIKTVYCNQTALNAFRADNKSVFTKGGTADFKIYDDNNYIQVNNGYTTTTYREKNSEFVLGEWGYLRDFPDAEYRQYFESNYKELIVSDFDFGQEVYDNLKLHTLSIDGKIVGIGFISGVFEWGEDSEASSSPRKHFMHQFQTKGAATTFSEYPVTTKWTLVGYEEIPCVWDLSCGQEGLEEVDNYEARNNSTVTFKDLDGNVVHQEEVPYFGEVQIIPEVPAKEGYGGAWFANEELCTGIYEDKVIYPVYYKIVAEHGKISTENCYRSFFDDYSSSDYELYYNSFYNSNGLMTSRDDYVNTKLTQKTYGNTVTLGYIGTIHDLKLYTENSSEFRSMYYYKDENYKYLFTREHYGSNSADYASEYAEDLPVYIYIDEETGEIIDIVVLYSAFAMEYKDGMEHAVIGFFDPQGYEFMSVYSLAPSSSEYGTYPIRPLWHIKDGVENFSLDIFKDLKNIRVTYVDENGETIYEEMVSLGASVENVPAFPEKEGYTGNWDQSGTYITKDTVISPVYTLITHTVTINLDGGRTYVIEVNDGEDVGLPDVPPEKEGYIGRWDDDGKNITEDRVINAIYEKQPFVVTFVVDGEVVATQEVQTGGSAVLPGVPEKAGYDVKWNHDGKNITADTTITAVYSVKTYTVTFIANGSKVSIQEVEHGKDAVEPAVPEKEGHTGKWNGNFTNVTGNRTISAVYTPIKYNVRYYDEEGELVSKQTVAYGQDADEPEVPESKNSPGAGGRWDHDGKNITENTYINPIYTYETHRVRYYVEGELYNTQYVNNTQDAIPPAVPAKEGHNGSWDHDGRNITKDTRINAVYNPKKYHVIFYADGKEVDDVQVKYGSSAKAPAIPEKEGYSARWDKPINRVTSNMEVNAIYSVKVYQVKFYVNGEFHSYQNVEHGSNVAFPNVAQIEGCTFVWDNEGNNVKSDLNINGVYKLNGYTIDKVAGTTNEVVPEGVYYGLSYGNAIGTGKNERLDVTGFNEANEAYNLVFWREDISAEGSFTLSVPEQVEAPVVEIDYVAGTTKDIVGTDVYYGTNENAMVTTGTNEKLTLVPGTTYYFYRPSDGEKLPSDTTEVCAGQKETMPDIGIDYSNVRTDTEIGSDIIYGTSEDEMVNTGEGEKISLTPGQDIYFQRKGSEENQTFSSDIFHLVVPERPVITRYSIKDETIKGKGDGRLYDLPKNIKYRWQKVDSNTYSTATFTADYISVEPGEWKLRIQPTDTSFASEYVYFTIEEGRALSLTVLETKGGETLNVIEGLSYREAIPVPEDPTRKGYVFDGWYWDNNGNESAFKFSSGISTDRTVYAKWTEAEEEVIVNELSGDKWIANFGTVSENDIIIPESIEITITNNGENDINIIWEEPEYYTLSGPETIAAGASGVYTVQPIEDLYEAGNYDEEILIYNADNFDSYYFINALYTIEAAEDDFDIGIKEDGEEIEEDGLVVEIGEEIELEADIDAITSEAPVLYSRLRAAPAAKAVPEGYSVRWEDIDGNVIGTELKCSFGPFDTEGYYHYFLIITGPNGNSTTVPFTIYAGDKENDHRITISPGSYKFGTDRTKVAEFTIGNYKGTEAVELTNIGSLKEFKGEGESSFIFGGELFEKAANGENVVLGPGESISFTVQPKEGLEPGVHAEMVGAGVGNGTNYALAAVGYTEPEKLAITACDDITVFTGSNVKLSAKATGGSGKYTYEWINTETGKVVSRKSSALFGSSYTGNAGTYNFEVTATDSNGNTVTEKVKVNIVERSYDIVLNPGKLDFGTDLAWSKTAKGQSVVITNKGNSPVTLKSAESEYFNISNVAGIVLEPGESIEIAVKPKVNLGPGRYAEKITVITEEGSEAEFKAVYTITAISVKVEENEDTKEPVVPEKSEDEENPNTGADLI